MRSKGFTLVELLAVIVILAIILAIAVPGISSLIESSKISTFEQSTRMIIKGIDINRKADSSFDVDGLNADNIDEALGIDNNNYKLLRAAATNDEVYVDIVGKNQWEGLEYYGTLDNLTLIKKGTYTLAPESCFTFNSTTKTITKYNLNNPSCPSNPEIPDTIGGVAVEHLGPGSFITPIEHWCTSDTGHVSVALNYVHTEGDGYYSCYYISDWDNPGPLTAVKLPRGTKTIGYEAFMYNQLEDIFIPNGVTAMGDSVFSNNLLTDVYLPNSLTTIGAWAFGANNISNINIPRSLTILSFEALGSNLLTSMTIPSHITSIEAGVFCGNQNLERLVVDSANPVYKSVNNGIYTKDGTTLVVGTKGMANNIENTITTIGRGAFKRMGLTSVTIPNSVTKIENEAFLFNDLTSITLPNTLTTIGMAALATNKLSSITIPSSVTSIEYYAFVSNTLTSITMGRTGTTIANNLLNFSNNNFRTSYTAGGAGTYTGTQNGTWTKQ